MGPKSNTTVFESSPSPASKIWSGVTPVDTSSATSGHQLGHQLKTVIALVCKNGWPDPNNFLYDHNTMMYGHIYRVEDTGKCLRA